MDFLYLDNLILAVDSYKVTHHVQYPKNTEHVYSYFESRGGKFKEIVFFGLQYIIKRWLLGKVITYDKVKEAKELFKLHFGQDLFNEQGWIYIIEKWNGCLPLRIKAIPEGTVVTVKNVLLTVENTDPKCFWLTNYIESLILQVWYPSTVATISRNMKTIILKYLKKSSDNINSIDFQLHDFGFRGCSSVETSSIGGAAHLVNFKGTDTIACLWMLKQFYNEKIGGFSIPASEHSTITTWGQKSECEAFENMLRAFPNGTIACVSDSYDIYKACKEYWGTKLIDRVKNRNGTLIIRPDSGEPEKILPEILHILGEKFGTTMNTKGYKMLPGCLKVIQGDGIDVDKLDSVCLSIVNAGWSMSNLNFGCGSGLLQKHNRDTQMFAYKTSYAIINGQSVTVFKSPITDVGKVSKKGRLTLEKTSFGYHTTENSIGDCSKDCLITVFENGELLRDYSFQEVRQNAVLEDDNPIEELYNHH